MANKKKKEKKNCSKVTQLNNHLELGDIFGY